MEKNLKDLNKWEDILNSWIGRLTIVRMAILSKLIYKFNAILMKIPAGFFADIDKVILKFT